MRAGRLDREVSFYTLSSTRGEFNESIDTWTLSFTTWGTIQYAGGDFTLSSDEKFHTGSVNLTIRYRSSVVETMRVYIDSDKYSIDYIERIGRKQGLRITLTKINE